MIVVRLIGGLGNQLFQYAAARRLAHKHNTVLKLDITPFEKYKLHAYSLHPFNIQENLATREDIERFNPDSKFKMLVRRITGRPCVGNVFYASDFVFESGILSAPDNIYMIGYWQSEKYFEEIKEIVSNELTVKSPQEGKDREVAARISDVESVSLHIRRTDYVTDPTASQRYGICGIDHYKRCVEYLAERVASPHFFVFSDDMAWAEENLKMPFPVTFVGHNDAARNYEDLRLMSQCRHNIIANSSFSWWGAWLNRNPGKIVLAPKKWLSNADPEPEKLIPESWITI